MAQFVAFAVSVLVALGIAHSAFMSGSMPHVRVHMPPKSLANTAGISGGGPVGMPTPQPIVKHH